VRSRGVKVRCACPPARLMPPACRMRGMSIRTQSVLGGPRRRGSEV
jgi:hypothetical protein